MNLFIKLITIVIAIIGIYFLFRLTQVAKIRDIFKFNKTPVFPPKPKFENNEKFVKDREFITMTLERYLSSEYFIERENLGSIENIYTNVNEYKCNDETMLYAESFVKYFDKSSNTMKTKYSYISFNNKNAILINPPIYGLIESNHYYCRTTRRYEDISIHDVDSFERFLIVNKINDRLFYNLREKVGTFEEIQQKTIESFPTDTTNELVKEDLDLLKNINNTTTMIDLEISRIRELIASLNDVHISIAVSEFLDDSDIIIEKIHEQKKIDITEDILKTSQNLLRILKEEEYCINFYQINSIDVSKKESLLCSLINKTTEKMEELESL